MTIGTDRHCSGSCEGGHRLFGLWKQSIGTCQSVVVCMRWHMVSQIDIVVIDRSFTRYIAVLHRHYRQYPAYNNSTVCTWGYITYVCGLHFSHFTSQMRMAIGQSIVSIFCYSYYDGI